ncbi:MAG: hypothetical protein QOF48_2611 [Verrucomicrobiota bacterium]|jgi:putative heme-binding domain-containing protein
MRCAAFRGCSASGLLLLFLALNLAGADLVDVPQLGVRLPRGFRVTLFSDAEMANDIYAMTLDARGNVVVTSQGYVRTLLDRNQDGVADDAVEFAHTRTGGMGLCFDGYNLLFVGDGGLWRFTDANGDGVADGPATKLFSIEFAEHGGHAVRRGPDGAWYVMAGNDAKLTPAHVTAPSSAIRRIEGGALLRLGADGMEVVAHGFRNPYDFDWNDFGDIFTYDSDCESDYFLPWYSPTRIYHVAPGGHHGWRLEGYTRSWPRPDYYSDTVGILARVGRGSPTGVACYRHSQFPPYFHNGLFALDWTFGQVWFVPLQPQATGSSYGGVPEVFMEPIGNSGFAPTDIAVARDGSLFISIGGRKTRGAVYHVQYVAQPERSFMATNWYELADTTAAAVVNAPQPLEEWSRTLWLPLALQVGAPGFAAIALDRRESPERRCRAVELLTEVFGGMTPAVAAGCAQSPSGAVRARAAWSIGRSPPENYVALLLGLARDTSPYVRTAALEALREHAGELEAPVLQQALALNIAYAEKRVHQAAAGLAAILPDAAFRALWTQQQKDGLAQARLTLTLALLSRTGGETINTNAIDAALAVLSLNKIADQQLQALRLIILALGDFHLRNPAVEVNTGYETPIAFEPRAPVIVKIQRAVTPLFPTRDTDVNFELARLLAMVRAEDPALPDKFLAQISPRSTPSDDFHYLAALSRLRAPIPSNSLAKIAYNILVLDTKLNGLEQRPKQNWSTRLAEVLQELLKNEPRLADALLRDPQLTRPGNLPLVARIGSARYMACARIFLRAVQQNTAYPWTAPLIDLLGVLPPEETAALFRRQWPNMALRDRLAVELAHKPEVVDRDKFLAGLASADVPTAEASLGALLALPPDGTTRALVPAMRLLRTLLDEPKQEALRASILKLVIRESGQPLKAIENPGDLRHSYQPIFDWFATKYPGLARELDADDREDPAKWNSFLKTVQWQKGNAARGEILFQERGCVICHVGPRPIGPDLGGITGRLSNIDLFNSILFPSREVAPPYRTTHVRCRDGSAYTGMVAFDSADGLILQTSATATVRLAQSEIVSRQPSSVSLMPAGLLAGMTPSQFADLYACLMTLRPGR